MWAFFDIEIKFYTGAEPTLAHRVGVSRVGIIVYVHRMGRLYTTELEVLK